MDNVAILNWVNLLGGRDGILEEQRAYANREHREHRSMYGPYICQIPADMLAVITMHRLMGLLMSDQEHGCVKVIHAAVVIGEAVEQEVTDGYTSAQFFVNRAIVGPDCF